MWLFELLREKMLLRVNFIFERVKELKSLLHFRKIFKLLRVKHFRENLHHRKSAIGDFIERNAQCFVARFETVLVTLERRVRVTDAILFRQVLEELFGQSLLARALTARNAIGFLFDVVVADPTYMEDLFSSTLHRFHQLQRRFTQCNVPP